MALTKALGGVSSSGGLIGQASFSASGGSISGLAVAGIISTVTRVSAGRYTVTFASAQPDVNYAAHMTVSDDNTAAMFCYYAGLAANYTVNGFDFYTYAFGPNTPQDRAVVRVTIFRL